MPNEEDAITKQADNSSAIRLKESAYENLGFSDNMSYE